MLYGREWEGRKGIREKDVTYIMTDFPQKSVNLVSILIIKEGLTKWMK